MINFLIYNHFSIKNSIVMQKTRVLLEPLKLNVATDLPPLRCLVLRDKVFVFIWKIFDMLELYWGSAPAFKKSVFGPRAAS